MLLQYRAVACIVMTCVTYSSWTLMPATWRRVVASGLMRNRVLAHWSVLQRAAKLPSAGACGGCNSCGSDKGGIAKTTAPKESVIHFMPHKPQ